MNLRIQHIRSNVLVLSVIVAMLGLFLPFNWSSFTVIILIFVWLFNDSLKEKLKNLQKNRKFLFVSGLYLIYVFGVFYTSNVSRGITLLEKNLTLLILPIVFASSKPLNLHKDYIILSVFAFANLLVGALLIAVAAFHFFETGSTSFFYYDKLTDILDFHPVYLSMYVLFSIVIIIYGYTHKMIVLKPIFFYLLILFALALLVLLSSKIVLSISVIVLLYFMFNEIKNKRIMGVSIVVFLILFATALYSFSTTKDRIKEIADSEWNLITKDYFAYNDAFTGITLRIITWKLAVKHLWNDENVLFGVSPGDSQDFVNNVYAKYGMDAAGYTGFNLHNQYVEMLVKSGFIGLIFFLSWIIFFYKEAISRKKVYFYFLTIFFTIAFTESNLEVHRGIVFFALFNSVFFFSEPDEV